MAFKPARTSKGQAGREHEVPTPALPDGAPAVTGWLLRGKDGRLTAYAPSAGGVLRWTEVRPGGPEWTGPELVAPATGLDPRLTVAQGGDGYVHLVALRRTTTPAGEARTDIVHAIQYQSGRPVKDWSPLGTPYRDQEKAAKVGHPAAVVDSADNLWVFVRNAGGGLCARGQLSSGKWGNWKDLTGSGSYGTICASTAEEGRIDVLAPAKRGVMRWTKGPGAGEFEQLPDLKLQVANGSVSAQHTGEGRITFFWREADGGQVHAFRSELPAVPLDGDASGPVAVLRTPVDGHDCTLMAMRGPDGRPALAAYPTEAESAGAVWASTGEVCAGVPALATDASGRVVLAAFGTDGRLRVTRQKTTEPGLALEPWGIV
ncbi:hypothetical protein [Streptomyces sp. ERV7]|uniref:hypothetical protein n=1 Tax=Streptomyces sp. ERV7 TaxID=1322334 RepID=UPI000A4A698F|nr:hypothetical protein [Streptomyces sp. ERV7]